MNLHVFMMEALACVNDHFILAATLHHFLVTGRELLVSAAVSVFEEGDAIYFAGTEVQPYAKIAGGYKDQQCKRYGEYGPEGLHRRQMYGFTLCHTL